MLLELSKIRRDGGTQPRSYTDPTVVSEYAEAMERGEIFPDVRAVYDGTEYWLVDGFHRVEAMLLRGQVEIGCEILQGTQADAQWMSYSVNARHGQPRTRWDLQRAIAAALQHPMCAGLSDRAIGEHIGCDHKTVAVQRKKLEGTGEVPQSDTRVGSDGVTRTLPGTRSETVPLIAPPEGGWPERDEDGSFSTELAEPIFENKGHAQAVIHVLEIAPLSYAPSKRRWISNAALVGVAGCGLSKPLMDSYNGGSDTREAAIARAAQELAEHILRCLQNEELPESRQSTLRHFFAWADTQGADAAKAAQTIEKEAQELELSYIEHAEQLLSELGGLVDPRYPDERKGAYDWTKLTAAMDEFLGSGNSNVWRGLKELVDNIDEAAEHFALIAAALRKWRAKAAQ